MSSRILLVAIPVAVLVGSIAATILSTAGRFAAELRSWKGKSVSVRLWNTDPVEGSALQIENIRAVGVGLHFWFRSRAADAFHLKIAQPKKTLQTSTTVRIEEAAYVQWQRRRVERRADAPAVTLSIVT